MIEMQHIFREPQLIRAITKVPIWDLGVIDLLTQSAQLSQNPKP